MRFSARCAGMILVSVTLISATLAKAQTTNPAPPAQTDTPPPPPPPYGGPHSGGPEHRVEMLQRELNLTPDQTAQVKALLETERSKMEALRSNTALGQGDRRSQMMAIHGDTTTKMHALLSAEQATKYDAMQAHMREHRGDGGNPPPPPAPGGPGSL